MWKEIVVPSDIKNYPVGTQVRIDGNESVIDYHYSKGDNGFSTKDPICLGGSHVFIPEEYDCCKVEVWEENYEQPSEEDLDVVVVNGAHKHYNAYFEIYDEDHVVVYLKDTNEVVGYYSLGKGGGVKLRKSK